MDARQHIIREAIEEQRQIFGAENPDKQRILSSWDTWEKNPFYHGPEQQHPEDDTPQDEWEAHQVYLAEMKNEVSHACVPLAHSDDDIPF